MTISGAMKRGVPYTELLSIPLADTLSLSQISTSPVSGSKNILPNEISRYCQMGIYPGEQFAAAGTEKGSVIL